MVLNLAITRQATRGMDWTRKAEAFREECPLGGERKLKAPVKNPGTWQKGMKRRASLLHQ